MLKKATSATVLFLMYLALTGMARGDAPEWLRSLAKQPSKTYSDDANVVILLNNKTTTVKENGEIVKRGRLAWKILRPEGKNFSEFPVSYDSDSRVEYLHGWSITSKGQEYESKDIFEQTVSSYEVYSDTKVKVVRVPGADVGTVMGVEFEQKARPYILQDFWDFQTSVPVEQSRYELHLASGWRFRADWVNSETKKPTEENGALVWQMSDVPRIEREPHRPPSDALAGRMVVTFLSDKAPNKSYRDWSEFGSWYTELASGVRQPSPALQQKVQEIAPDSLPLLQRIKTLAGFAQHDVRYVEIKIGVGGWRPHSATDVFTHRYGDCKDKATVLSSMLSQIGVKSYYVLVDTERGIFTKGSPPQARFDHMILAIALPDATSSQSMPALYVHPKYGRLLIFDPTQEFVPFGQIPYYEQDNYGLLVGDQGGELIHLPLSNPESNRVTRTARLRLLPDGTLQGEVEEIHSGFAAMLRRYTLQHETEQDRKKAIERVVGRSIGSFQLDHFEIVNASDIDKNLIITYGFTAERYAKTAGTMLLVRPRVVGEMAGTWDANKPRHYAYDFPAPFHDVDNVEITLPEGFKVYELPDPTKASFPFAEYTSKTQADGGVLKYSRDYKMTLPQVPFSDIEQLKKLFAEITTDEKNMAVLKKAN
jgi:hypothetical protein